MALPTKTDVQTGQFSLNGSPWINVAANSSIDVNTLEFSLDGSPWNGVEETGVTNIIKKVSTVLWTSIKKINGVSLANIKKINSVSSS